MDSYNVYLSSSPSPSLYTTVSSTTTSITLPPLPSGTYYWRVEAVNADGLSSGLTGVKSFTLCQINNPTNPVISSPVSNSFLRGPVIEVQWLDTVDFSGGSSCSVSCPVGEFNRYSVIISRTRLFDDGDVRSTVNHPQLSASGSVDSSSVFYIYVQATSCFGSKSLSLPVVVFICLDRAPLPPVLTLPSDGETVGRSVSFSWELGGDLGVVCQIAGQSPPSSSVRLLLGSSPARMLPHTARSLEIRLEMDHESRRATNYNGAPAVVKTILPSETQTAVVDNLDPATDYFWAIEVDNGRLTTTSNGCELLECVPGRFTCDPLLVNPVCVCNPRLYWRNMLTAGLSRRERQQGRGDIVRRRAKG